MVWGDILSKIPTTQKPAAESDIVSHPAASFDKLAREIANASNAVVIFEGARDQFEIQVEDERGRIMAELIAAEQKLADLRRQWDAMTDARGVRGVLPSAVSKPEINRATVHPATQPVNR